ncbi:hypothetical protein [Streptomyces sp. NPDC126499]|uniref:hypothetical protein n=1 Tax=Streptomyces sp. NPDC126499 TaxID=3155314 RepID=UPI00332CD34B
MRRTSRGAVASLALACAVALLGSGTAAAADSPYAPVDPVSLPGGCATSGELPWVGNTSHVTLAVKVQGQSPTGGLPEAHFRLWRAGQAGTPVVDTTVPTSGGSTATLRVPGESLPPEGPYWWQVRLESAGRASEWTVPCGFSTDYTPPAAPAVTFLDATPFPNASDPGTVRTVRLALPEGTEAAYFCVDPEYRDRTLPCPAGGRVPVGADGTATTTFVTPERSGPATFWARAVDRAGNPSDAVGAEYWVNSPFPEPFGDYDSDGRADLLGVDAQGRLTLAAGVEGGFSAPVVADGRDWSGAVVARAGHLINRYGPQEPNDVRNDLVARQGAKLLVYPGDGRGGFGAPAEIAGYDWSGVSRIAVNRTVAGLPKLVAVEGDRLLVFDLYEGGVELRAGEPTVLAASGWAGRTIVASEGRAEMLAAGVLARDPVRGSLEFAGVDYGWDAPYVLAEPVVVAGSGWEEARVPALVAAGDLTGDERIDLVTTDPRGGLVLHPAHEDGTLGAPAVLTGSGFEGVRLF